MMQISIPTQAPLVEQQIRTHLLPGNAPREVVNTLGLAVPGTPSAVHMIVHRIDHILAAYSLFVVGSHRRTAVPAVRNPPVDNLPVDNPPVDNLPVDNLPL